MKRILFLMSDTGGGHRAAAEAISAALKEKHGDQVEVQLADVFKHYSMFPFNRMPELYPVVIKRGKFIWRLGYRSSNRKINAQKHLVMRSVNLGLRRGLRRLLLRETDADVIVSVHPIFNIPAMSVLRTQTSRPPFMTVITDLVSTHIFWYEKTADRILVPTQPAYDRGIGFGIPPEKMRVTGLPVHPRFTAGLIDKREARERLGWDKSRITIMMVGGGEGMGPLYAIARRIDRLKLPNVQLAIIAGRNEILKTRLESCSWNQPTHVYGFVSNMPELMAASDLLVTKAGPGTISEACLSGLPMILSDAIPGQEEGNVTYLTDNGAGLYAPGAHNVARVVADWVTRGADFLRERAADAAKLGRPDAVWQIADEIWEYANHPRIQQQPRIRRVRRTNSKLQTGSQTGSQRKLRRRKRKIE
jgi:1,2-diacylglycerol 3-beta-galactosyltransferase